MTKSELENQNLELKEKIEVLEKQHAETEAFIEALENSQPKQLGVLEQIESLSNQIGEDKIKVRKLGKPTRRYTQAMKDFKRIKSYLTNLY